MMTKYEIEQVAKRIQRAQFWLPTYKLFKLLFGRYLALQIVMYFINKGQKVEGLKND